ncbi:copper resistance protein CopC [Streptomyces griseiscabiei]|uniref:Secreted protein n=1 Tax=Streptomyces griseiscabiei TaxID=2993540 RepID=A0ABU4LCD3_9ACTN|nr:copper resistance protein CopC [Streptomyces griseiscabiei]MBZ3900249.1 hypothetical protein [Streptomyces griseiscabiei]MDX2913258.1 hypothetical protein [Streptomyces griseiscabiei]
MGLNRRTAMRAALLTTVVSALGPNRRHAQGTSALPTLTVQGEAAVRTNIPVVRDRRASGGRYLALATGRTPGPQGWYATYAVRAPEAGVYALTAIATAPVEVPHTEATASYFRLALNEGPFREIARSQPYWYESKPAWGDLSELDLGVLELRCGENTLTFRVTEPTVVESGTAYALALDRFTLKRRTGVRVRRVSVGDGTLNTYRHGEPALLTLTLDGRPARPLRVRHTVVDHIGRRVAAGDSAVAAGETTVRAALPRLPPGNYRVTVSAADDGNDDGDDVGGGDTEGVTAHFACLPARPAAPGDTNRFGVNVWATSLVPPSRVDAFAAAMKDMGAGWTRDGRSWPATEPTPGAYDTAHHDRLTTAMRRHGLSSLEVVSPAPAWAMTDASLPLPADLRHAYRYARRIASRHPAAVQLSNEPDVDVTSGTGDAHAAFVKAAALGVADTPDAPLVVLPGIAQAGHFQDLMLANDVVRYADVWAFHGYPDPAEQDEPAFPGAADEQRDLAVRQGAGDVPRWMTECGAFLTVRPGVDLTPAQQAVQARYAVRSTVEGLAAGNARQFWFAGPPLHDDGVYFGLLSREFQPLPAYSAYAALTSLLGEAHFAGPVDGLPAGVAGFAFDSGRGETVRVFWAAKPVRVPVPGALVYDVMGGLLATDGTVTVSRDPVYAVTATGTRGGGAPQIAPPAPPRPVRRRRAPLSPAEHIVLSQRHAARNAAPNKDNGDAEPPLGYRLSRRTRMSLDVYNFTDTTRTVTVRAEPAGGWAARAKGPARLEVPAQGRRTLEFTITAGSGVERRTDHRLTFTAALDGVAVPPSVSVVQLR